MVGTGRGAGQAIKGVCSALKSRFSSPHCPHPRRYPLSIINTMWIVYKTSDTLNGGSRHTASVHRIKAP